MNNKLDISDMSAEVYTQNAKGVYYVKVGFPKIGLWINSWTVRRSDKYPEKGLWVQPPSFFMGRWIKVLEFRNDSELFDLISDEILRAVDIYNREKNVPVDSDISLEDINDIFPD